MLKAEHLSVAYSDVPIVKGISISVGEQEIVSIVGANGAGKSTILKAISGLVPVEKGRIFFLGQSIENRAPDYITKLGIAHVPEGRQIFGKLTVHENLLLALYNVKSKKDIARRIQEIFDKFPILGERQKQLGDTLSGGEQQLLAVARALVQRPRLLILDEPSLGLMPIFVDYIFNMIQEINRMGMTMLLVDQNVQEALEMSRKGYVLQTGEIVLEGTNEELLGNEMVKKAFLGL